MNPGLSPRRIEISEVTDLQIEGVDMGDYPDFCDAYFSEARWKSTGEPLTEEELEILQRCNGEALYELALNCNRG